MRNWYSLPARFFRAASLAAAVMALLPAAAAAAERWQMQYFYDEARSTFEIRDLAFPSAKRGVAAGAIVADSRTRGACAVTSDGGEHWAVVPLPAPAISVYFLNDTLGWVVTEKGVYRTEEAGRAWKKISAPKETLRVYFLDAQRGFAVGIRKSVFETGDGGKHWHRLPAADAPKARPEYTVYTWITFVSPQIGMITGWNRPPRRTSRQENLPAWMEPEKAVARKEWPNLFITLETRTGGKTWTPNTSSIFGRISRVRLAEDGRGLGLVEFTEQMTYPSEVFVLNWKTGRSARAYRDKQCAVTDVALAPSGPAYLAGVEAPGRLQHAPIPGKLRILRSDDLKVWHDMDVDYRATARRAVMACPDAAHVWVATDTGMILKLTR